MASFKPSKHVRDVSSAPYPPRSPPKPIVTRSTRRNARSSPTFVTPEPATPSNEDESSQATPIPASAPTSGGSAPAVHVTQPTGPVLVETDADNSRRIPSVNLPALQDPSPSTSPPLPQHSALPGGMLFAGDRPRNASFDVNMFMPLEPMLQDVPHPPHNTFDFDNSSVIDYSSGSETHSPPLNASALGFGNSNTNWALNYASSSLANAMGTM
ncbi:hypothetical protein EXIGLDRAFT_488161 [Exidia glandulosa HHB12029]|uniref:Uncharacterized protein n=1 Tax=Exidia glandulosa HHB12029 TaxID=1314781 RepID=A0A166ATV9_EXIGL|nr:hypothetical protein EXIGLDRAFT_488161 [Exidia glandulosa HHB12029]